MAEEEEAVADSVAMRGKDMQKYPPPDTLIIML